MSALKRQVFIKSFPFSYVYSTHPKDIHTSVSTPYNIDTGEKGADNKQGEFVYLSMPSYQLDYQANKVNALEGLAQKEVRRGVRIKQPTNQFSSLILNKTFFSTQISFSKIHGGASSPVFPSRLISIFTDQCPVAFNGSLLFLQRSPLSLSSFVVSYWSLVRETYWLYPSTNCRPHTRLGWPLDIGPSLYSCYILHSS
ncbi:hypothetical protein BgiMline_000200 [Biomphalaria glabrata]|nr:hypothetical protein BgiMline_000192 [Biomphalaria glabrata]